jgi:two-component system chemotaxis response regulator CheB
MKDFYAVGIGASGGGIDALTDFFDHIGPAPGIAFIIVTHIKRDHRSRLDSILSKHTNLPVVRADQDMKIQPDHVYLLIENTFVTVQNGTLIVRERQDDEIINRAVNLFFVSLAKDFKEKAIGIVLSGGGNDGLDGVNAIGEAGGYVMVQTPDTSLFSGMPTSVIEHDHPSVIMDPADLAKQLLHCVHHSLL